VQFITGRIVIVGNNQEIKTENGSFSSVILVIKKRMNKKVRNIAFKCYGKIAEQVLNYRMNDKIEIEYFLYSNQTINLSTGDSWFTTLQVKSVERIPNKTKKEKDSEINFDNYYGNKIKKSP